MGESSTSKRKVTTAIRRVYVLGLRAQGYDYRRIAELAILHFGAEALPKNYCCRYASKDVRKELRKLETQTSEAAQEVRRLDAERLDFLLLQLWPSDDPEYPLTLGAVDRILKIMERRAKLLGLDAPAKIAHTDPTGTRAYNDTDFRRLLLAKLTRIAETKLAKLPAHALAGGPAHAAAAGGPAAAGQKPAAAAEASKPAIEGQWIEIPTPVEVESVPK